MLNSQDYALFPVRSSLIVTNSYVAGTTVEKRHLKNQLVLLVDVTIGSLTSVEVKLEFSDDNSNFYQETVQSVSGGTLTETLAEHEFTATGLYRVLVPTKDKYIRISTKGTGTVTGSLVQVDVISGVS